MYDQHSYKRSDQARDQRSERPGRKFGHCVFGVVRDFEVDAWTGTLCQLKLRTLTSHCVLVAVDLFRIASHGQKLCRVQAAAQILPTMGSGEQGGIPPAPVVSRPPTQSNEEWLCGRSREFKTALPVAPGRQADT